MPQENINFVSEFNKIAAQINETAIEKGWWKGDRNEGGMIMTTDVERLVMRCHDCKHPIHDDDDARVCINCGGRNRRIVNTNKSWLASQLELIARFKVFDA